ncbi:MAG: hypothetical protein QF463_04250 [Vicinamibacterales bacterium]|nr:hypothetical protein [Vicinamibacterales bacterium]MDP6608256.1 hypothetical protein [Vicinamibacterales bacterium]
MSRAIAARPWFRRAKAGLGLALLLGSSLVIASSPPRAAQAPRLTVIAVGLPGTLLNAVGTGIARLVTENTPTRMRVRVASGIDALVARVMPISG